MDSSLLKREMLIYVKFQLEYESLIENMSKNSASLSNARKVMEFNTSFNRMVALQREKIVLCGGYVANVMSEKEINVLATSEKCKIVENAIFKMNLHMKAMFPYGVEIMVNKNTESGRLGLIVYTHHSIVDKVIDTIDSFGPFNGAFNADDFLEIAVENQRICQLSTIEELNNFKNLCISSVASTSRGNESSNDLRY